MNKLFVLILSLLLFKIAPVAFASDKVISPGDKHIQYVGRWDKSEKGIIRSYWGGAYFNVKFHGNTLSLKLDKSVDIYVILDEGKPMLFKKAKEVVKITSDSLKTATHTLRVVARFQDDEIELTGLILNNGGKLLNPEKKKFWVEYIGDSITSGDRTSKGNMSAYPWLCSEALGVNHTQISYCGIPLVNGFHYNYKGAPEIGMESAYLNLKQPNNNSPEWDFSQASPNLLVINLGTNDNNLKVDTILFKQTYTQFFRNLRFVNQNAVIMVLIPFNQVYKNQITALVSKEAERDKNLKLIPTEGWLTSSDFVDGTHPTDAGHLKISEKLTPIINNAFIKN